MIRTAYKAGVHAAAKRFGIREASALQMLLDAAPVIGGGAALGTAKALAPGVFQGLERLKSLPVAGLRKILPKKLLSTPGSNLGRLGLPPGGTP